MFSGLLLICAVIALTSRMGLVSALVGALIGAALGSIVEQSLRHSVARKEHDRRNMKVGNCSRRPIQQAQHAPPTTNLL